MIHTKRWTERFVLIFNYAFLCVPLLMSVYLALVYLLGGWGAELEGHTPEFYFLEPIQYKFGFFLFPALWAAAIFTVTAGTVKLQKYIQKNRTRSMITFLWLAAFAFVIRFLFLYLFSEDLIPHGDFFRAWMRANGDLAAGNMPYYSLFPAYLNFSFYEHLIVQRFGSSYITVLYFNALYSALTAGLVYLIAREITTNEWVTVLAGVMYSLYPTNIIYLSAGTPEFFSILLNTLGLWLLVRVVKSDTVKKKIIGAALAGVCLGIGSSLKTFSPVILIAFAMVSVIRAIFNRENKGARERLLMIGLSLLVVFSGYKLSSSAILSATSDHYDMSLSGKTAVPHFLLIGLNTEGEGQIHVGGLSRLYNQRYLSNGMDFEEAKNYAYDQLKEDWKNNPGEIVPNFGKKMIWVWQDDQIPLWYFLKSVGISPDTDREHLVYDFLAEHGHGLTQMTYTAVMLSAAFGALSFLKKRDNISYEFVAFVIFGYFCMMLLAEAQSRYKCLIMPYLVIIAALGWQNIEKENLFVRSIKKWKSCLS